MARGNQTTLTLRLIDGVSRPGRAVRDSIAGVNRAIGSLRGAAFAPLGAGARSAEQFAASLGRAQAAGAGAGVGLTLGARKIVETEKALNRAVAAGNLSLDQRADAYANAIALNYKYGGSVDDVIGANTELLRSGLDYEAAKRALPDVMNLSQATGEDTIAVARAIVTSVTALRMGMDQTARSADLFVQALDRTAGVDLVDFETSGKYFNPVAAATGVSPEEAMAAQVEMAQRGIFGSSAGTGLRAGPAAVLAPTKKALASFARTGIDPRQFRGDRTGEVTAEQVLGVLEARGAMVEGLEDGIAAIVRSTQSDGERARAIIQSFGEQLGLATGEDRAELMEALAQSFASGSARADVPGLVAEMKRRGAGFADFEAVFGRNHASKFLGFDPAAYERELALLRTDAPGSTDRKAQTMMAGLPGDVNNAEGSLQALIAAISNAGALRDLSAGFRGVADGLSSIGDANPDLLRFGVLSAAALAAIVPLGFGISGIGAAAALALNPITLVGVSIAGLVALNWAPLSNGMRTFGNHFAKALDPSLVRRAREVFSSSTGLFSRARLGNLSLNRLAAGLGTGMAQAINQLTAAAPRIRTAAVGIVSALSAFGQSKFGEFMPKIEQGNAALRGMFDAMIGPKIDAFYRLGDALKTFGGNAIEGLSPAVSGAMDLVAASFNTLASGGQLVASGLGAALTGFTSFASGLLNAISPGAVTSIGNGLSSLFQSVNGYVTPLGNAFRSVTGFVDGSMGSIENFATMAGAKTGQAINGIVSALSGGGALISSAWEGIKSIFAAMGAYVPDFGPLVSTISSIASTISGLLDSIRSAAESAANAISGLGGGGGARSSAIGAMGGAAYNAQQGPLPRKASGGAVRRGPVLVGERGPEVVHLGGNGYVTPTHRLQGGGGTVNATFHIVSPNPEEAGRAVERKLERFASRSGQTALNR